MIGKTILNLYGNVMDCVDGSSSGVTQESLVIVQVVRQVFQNQVVVLILKAYLVWVL